MPAAHIAKATKVVPIRFKDGFARMRSWIRRLALVTRSATN